MTPLTRGVTVILVVAVVIAPIATVHPLYAHFAQEGHREFRDGLTNPATLALVLLALAGMLPLPGFVIGVSAWIRGARRLARLLRTGQPRSVGSIRYLRIPGEDVVLMTTGLFRPVIVVTEGAEAILSPDEFHAGLLHEQAHQHRLDVLWRALLLAVGRAFAFVPGLPAVVNGAVLRSECLADEDAIRGGANRSALFEAIVVASTASAPAASLSGADAEFRLRRLAALESELPHDAGVALTGLLMALGSVPLLGHALLVVGLVCTSHA